MLFCCYGFCLKVSAVIITIRFIGVNNDIFKSCFDFVTLILIDERGLGAVLRCEWLLWFRWWACKIDKYLNFCIFLLFFALVMFAMRIHSCPRWPWDNFCCCVFAYDSFLYAGLLLLWTLGSRIEIAVFLFIGLCGAHTLCFARLRTCFLSLHLGCSLYIFIFVQLSFHMALLPSSFLWSH